MSHGEQWIVPLNLFMIAAAVVLWCISLPLWTTFVIAVPLALVLAWFGIDKYGGMQIVMLIAPAFVAATIAIGKKYRDAIAAQEDIRVGSLLLEFIGTIVVLPVVLFAILAMFVGVALAWDWGRSKLGFASIATNQRVADEQSGEPEPPMTRDLGT